MASNLITETVRKDYEFIGFYFNGHHSSEYNLTVVSPSGLTQEMLFAEFEDNLVEVSGKEGAYYFGTKIRTKRLTLNLAFDNLTSSKKRAVLTWLNPKIVSKLIFDEFPFKYYWTKVASQLNFSFVPFEQDIINGVEHVFKGNLTFDFIAFDPFAYSDYALVSDVPIWDGTALTTYSNPPTNTIKVYDATHIPGWYGESGLHLTAPLSPELAYANDSNGFNHSANTSGTLVGDSATANFYNAGQIEVPIEFTITIEAAFAKTLVWNFTNTTSGEIFTLQSLRYLTGLEADAGKWTIHCDPSKGLITGTTTTVGLTGNVYNLNSLHNGVFLKAYPGDNFLSTDRTISAINIKYKYKYW